jgi:F-type H+-transporting ATPase subunit a
MIFADAFEHVLDTFNWHIFQSLDFEIHLPGIYKGTASEFGLTKYSILMVIAGALICWIYLPLAKKIQTGDTPTGTWWNFFESILTFTRDEIAKPYIGQDADRYVPYLWTVFLFVLVSNLLGMFPFMGSPTASFAMTSVMAFGSFLLIHVSSIMRFGFVAHLKSFAPHMDMPMAMKIPIWIMLWPIEFVGLILKCFVLSVRLFANMFAGHMVLATILLFIPAVAGTGAALEGAVTVASVLGVVALSMLELFVAFLQAYLFTFLTALFLGGVLEHAEHAAHGGDHHGHNDAGEEDVHRKDLPALGHHH